MKASSNTLFASALLVVALNAVLAVPPPHRRTRLGHIGGHTKRDDPPCIDPPGWNWAHYPSTLTSADEPTFDVLPFKTAMPDASGLTPYVGFNYGYVENATYYDDDSLVSQSQAFVVHHAYLHVPLDGAYTFNLKADNVALIWVGETALRGWQRDNAFLVNALPFDTTANSTMSLAKDTYVAVRVALLNTFGPSFLAMTVTGPDARRVDGSAFVQFGCNITANALPFAAWGEED